MPMRARTLTVGPIVRSAERAQLTVSEEDLTAAVGISRATLMRLVRVGVVERSAAGKSGFPAKEVR